MSEPISRRDLAKASLGTMIGAAALSNSSAAMAAHGVVVPALTPAFAMSITLGTPIEMGMVPGGRRRFIPITGGTVSGPKLQGIVLPGGGDWQTIGADGTTEIHARYALKATDGTVVEIDNPGVRVASPEIITRLTAGEDLDPALYYFRTTPRFSLPAGKHDWLRRNVFIISAVRHPSTVELQVFQVS